MKTIALLALAVLVPTVVGHGFVAVMSIEGKEYIGNMPQADQKPSPIRQIENTEPVQGQGNPDLNCGRSATLASEVADAQPGDEVSFDWKGGSDYSNWPHNTGPMLTYMASCGDQTCDKYVSAKAAWFKIDQVARRADGKWAQQDLFEGKVHTVTIPPTLAPGNYLIRHEIIALHLGESLGGAEFYPSCAQLRVGGSQTGQPESKDLVSFPGAYKDNDPGIFFNVYDPRIKDYNFPGPPISNVAAVSAGNPGTPTTSSTPTSTRGAGTSPATPQGTLTPSTIPAKQGTCKLKKRVASPTLVKRQSFKGHLSLHSRIINKLFH